MRSRRRLVLIRWEREPWETRAKVKEGDVRLARDVRRVDKRRRAGWMGEGQKMRWKGESEAKSLTSLDGNRDEDSGRSTHPAWPRTRAWHISDGRRARTTVPQPHDVLAPHQ
jgi:hypothetical protein